MLKTGVVKPEQYRMVEGTIIGSIKERDNEESMVACLLAVGFFLFFISFSSRRISGFEHTAKESFFSKLYFLFFPLTLLFVISHFVVHTTSHVVI